MTLALDKQGFAPLFGPINMASAHEGADIARTEIGNTQMNRPEVDGKIRELIEPFNKKGVSLADATTFVGDLEFDSLTVMDFVAEIEDEFDIIITMNQQAEIENFGQLVDAVTKLQD